MSVPTARRPDASMTLLNEVMQRPLDPGYAAAARRRAERQGAAATSATPASRVVSVLLLAIVGLIAVVSVRTLRSPDSGVLDAKTALLQRVRADTKAADQMQVTNDTLRLSNDKAQADLLRLQARGQLADQVQLLGMVSGSLAVQGPGLVITIHDAPSSQPTAGSDPRQPDTNDQGRVIDRDLQLVVNGLWAAGAEAVSINGQRLTALSAIRSAGSAILVDFRPLSPPYAVSAIGDSGDLRSDFAAGAGGTYLHSLQDNFGIDSDISAKTSMLLPASSGLTLSEVKLKTPSPEDTP